MIYVFDTIVTKRNQGVSSNLLVLCYKFCDVVPRASSFLRDFLIVLAIDIPQLIHAFMKEADISH